MNTHPLPATVSGVVTKYKGNGRKFGYPTANIAASTTLKDGVYFGFADLAEYKEHPALIFMGIPTTVGDTERRIEAHLLDIPDKDYYGQQVTLYIQRFHRSNQTFDSVEKLLEVMKEDDIAGRAWFKTAKVA